MYFTKTTYQIHRYVYYIFNRISNYIGRKFMKFNVLCPFSNAFGDVEVLFRDPLMICLINIF